MSEAVDTPAAPPDPRLVGRPDDSTAERRYRRMRFIRRFEETLLSLFEEGILNGTTHCCIGQEANAVAVVEALDARDHIFSNHRCHGHFLARTGDALGLLAEIMGKEAGLCRGIGGSQHICAPGFKSNGVQGGIVPAAAGIAWSLTLDRSDAVSTVFIGDGTLGEGVVYETLNIASLWRLPLWIIVEDNGWAQSTPRHINLAGEIAPRFEAFGVPTRTMDTTDVEAIAEVVMEEREMFRAQVGPRALVLHTYRLCHHSKNDDQRPVDEVEARRAIDPLAIFGPRIPVHRRSWIDAEVESGLAAVVHRARSLP